MIIGMRDSGLRIVIIYDGDRTLAKNHKHLTMPGGQPVPAASIALYELEHSYAEYSKT